MGLPNTVVMKAGTANAMGKAFMMN